MRALAHPRKATRKHDARALVTAAPPPSEESRRKPPAETAAWWLSRTATPTFARRRIPIPEACARGLGAAPGPIVVEFNGSRFSGAAIAADGALDLGDALATEMAEVLDEDDGLDVELLAGRGQPTLAIFPYVSR